MEFIQQKQSIIKGSEMYEKTTKSDWMNNLLAYNDYYVSDHSSFSEKLNIPIDYQSSLRFYGNVRVGYRFILVIKYFDIFDKTIVNNEAFKSTVEIFERVFSNLSGLHQGFTVLFYSDNEEYFIYYKNKFEQCNSQRLIQYFSFVSEELTANAGANKKINVSLNDSFQLWTRTYLSKYITFNDFDAFKFTESEMLNLIELKRPDQSTIQTWFPYKADVANYKACLNISNSSNSTKFCTIAYNSDDEEFLVCVYISNIGRDNQLSGTKYLGNIKDFDFNNMCFREPVISSENFVV